MRLYLCLIAMLILFSCGSCSSEDLFKKKYTGACDRVPSDLEEKIIKSYEENVKKRDHAIASERDRLQVEPLKMTYELMSGQRNMFQKPVEDPFPNSIVAVGDPYDIREKGYQVNHGKMGMTYIYETEPGSQQYFIVDEVGGDGIGGNGQEVVAETSEYGMGLSLSLENGNSWHSWHSNEHNELVRAIQNPDDRLIQEINICGCGPLREVNSAAGQADLKYIFSFGIFMLPGNDLPSFMNEDEFNATFEREYYKKNYVPKKGKKCEEYDWVC